jgi:hypothetical protein
MWFQYLFIKLKIISVVIHFIFQDSSITMANFLTKLFRLPFKKTFSLSSSFENSTLSGRWALDYDGTIQERKVYWANMDNCGCCNDVGNIVDVKKIQKKR